MAEVDEARTYLTQRQTLSLRKSAIENSEPTQQADSLDTAQPLARLDPVQMPEM